MAGRPGRRIRRGALTMDTVTENLHVAEIASTKDSQRMERPPADAPEHALCLYWRKEIMKMSRAELSEVIGFSASTITDMETGHNRSTKVPIDPAAMKRYRMACAGAALGAEFTWLKLKVIPAGQVEINFLEGK